MSKNKNEYYYTSCCSNLNEKCKLVDVTIGHKVIADVILTKVCSLFNNEYKFCSVDIKVDNSTKKYLKECSEHKYLVTGNSFVYDSFKYGGFPEFADDVVVIEEQVYNKDKEETSGYIEEIEKEEEKEMEPKIVISSDDKKVVEAKLVEKDKEEGFVVIAKGTSHCHPMDKFNFKEGVNYALKRLFKVIEEHEDKQLELFYKGKSYGAIGKPTKFRDAFDDSAVLVTGDQVQVLREQKSVKGIIADGLILTNDEILKSGKAYITRLKKAKDVKAGEVFAGTYYK